MTELSQTLTTDYRAPPGDYQRIQYIPVSQSTAGLQQPQHIQLQVVQVAPVLSWIYFSVPAWTPSCHQPIWQLGSTRHPVLRVELGSVYCVKAYAKLQLSRGSDSQCKRFLPVVPSRYHHPALSLFWVLTLGHPGWLLGEELVWSAPTWALSDVCQQEAVRNNWVLNISWCLVSREVFLLPGN